MKTPEILNQSPALTPPPRRTPLPEIARSPLILLAAALPAQVALLGVNLRSFSLMSGEMTPDQTRTAWLIFIAELLLLVGTAGYALRLHVHRMQVPWKANWAIFLSSAAYLVLGTLALTEGQIIPNSVSLWIVRPERVLFHQWVFVMPATFYALLSLACFQTKVKSLADAGLSILVTAGVPVSWYFVSQLRHMGNIPTTLWVVIAIGSCFLCIAAFLRFMTTVFAWARTLGPDVQWLLTLGVAIIGPLAGLTLNSQIPFPADFQSPVFYGLALLNGVLLAFPAPKHHAWERALWLARCAMFPFTAYFFLVFLPFLPLAIPAIVLLGAGLLMFVPTALLVLHAKSIGQSLRIEFQDGAGRRAVIWALLAASILPATIAGRAWFDRQSLNAAIDHVYTPDYLCDGIFRGNLWATRHALESLGKQKTSAYLPFLSEYYDWAVFGGLTLSTQKMQELHTAFFGKPMVFPEPSGPFAAGRRPLRNPAPAANATSDVQLESLTSESRIEQGCTATTVSLVMQNPTNGVEEYTTTIEIPPGAVVSGYWLHIGEERVPGRIFERKTAMWVYQMIRNVTRRDPGILTYTSPTTLDLRVYPFAAREQRVTEIEFLMPSGMNSHAKIAGQEIELSGPGTAPAHTVASGGSEVLLPANTTDALPAVKRQPHLHFIIDRSEGSKLSPRETMDIIQHVAAYFPAKDCMVTFANYESRDLFQEPHRVAHLSVARDFENWLPARGAFLRDRAIKRILMQYQEAFQNSASDPEKLTRFPIIVVIGKDSPASAPSAEGLEDFANLTPDIACYFTVSGKTAPFPVSFSGRAPCEERVRPVHIFRSEKSLAVCAANPGEPALARFSGGSDALEVFDPNSGKFEEVRGVTSIANDSRYAKGVEALLADREVKLNPSMAQSRLPGIIRRSRDSGVMVPASSYIVVENSAQWRALQQKEKEKLANNKSLDFNGPEVMETPEPSIIAVGVLALAIAGLRKWRSTRQAA